MQSVRIIYCYICKVSLFFSALYAKYSYFFVLYVQIRSCYLLLYIQSVLIVYCVKCNRVKLPRPAQPVLDFKWDAALVVMCKGFLTLDYEIKLWCAFALSRPM